MVLNNIKFNYNTKLIDDYFKNNNYQEIKLLLQKQKKNNFLYYKLFAYINNNYLNKIEHSNFFDNKFIWIISYDLDDTNIIIKFLNFYINKNEKKDFIFDQYESILAKSLSQIPEKNLNSEINFEKTVNHSDLYQNLILLDNFNNQIVANMSAAFFEAPNQKRLIYPQMTNSFFYVLQSPFKLYQRYKKMFLSSEAALDELNNYYEKMVSYEKHILDMHEIKISSNRQNFKTNFNSWTNENVKNSYKGMLIPYLDIIKNPEETLNNLLYHIKENGLNIPINFDYVEEFIKNNSDLFSFEIENESLSNKEKKMISNVLDEDIIKQFNLEN